MWDERYAAKEHAYGTEPNVFLKEYAQWLAGPVLSVAEGRGHNVVFLTSLGLEVLGVDGSAVGLAKACRPAEVKGMSVDTLVADLTDYEPPATAFGAAVPILVYLLSRMRGRLNYLLERSLRSGDLFLLEVYWLEQFGYGTGGPTDVDMLVSCVVLEVELPECEVLLAREIECETTGGRFRTSAACVAQFITRRRQLATGRVLEYVEPRECGLYASGAGPALTGWLGQVSVDRGTS